MLENRNILKLTVLYFLIFALFSACIYAKPITKDKSLKAAKTFLKIEQLRQEKTAEKLAKKDKKLFKSIQKHKFENTIPIYGEGNQILAWVTELHPEGYIVTSSDTDINPIIAYSFKGGFPFHNQHHPLNDLLCWDMKNRQKAIYLYSHSKKAKNNNLWQEYINSGADITLLSFPAATYGPILSTTWNQDGFYNDSCPDDPQTEPGYRYDDDNDFLGGTSDGRCLVGCTAVAIGQIIYHWEYPNSIFFDPSDEYTSINDPEDGSGEREIDIDGDHDNLNFSSFIELNNNLSTIEYNGDHDEIANLLFACGISVDMEYSDAESGSWPTEEAFINKFGYASADEIDGDDSDFYNVLQANMMNDQPAILVIWEGEDLQGSGHTIVCDGFQDTGKYYLNFGWGGTSDGWYSLPDEIPEEYSVVHLGILNIIAPDIVTNTPTDDTYISSSDDCEPAHYQETSFLIRQDAYGLLKFPLYHIPYGAYIRNVKLILEPSAASLGADNSITIELKRIYLGWDEESIEWCYGNPNTESVSIGTQLYTDSTIMSDLVFDSDDYPALRDTVQEWNNEISPNRGFLLKTISNDLISFASSNGPDEQSYPKLVVQYTEEPRYLYGGAVMCEDIGTSDPYPAINPTSTFYSDDPDHMCMRIHLKDVYRYGGYDPLIDVRCEFYKPSGGHYGNVNWSDLAPPSSGYWNNDYLTRREGSFVQEGWEFFVYSGEWTYKILIDEGNGFEQVDVGHFDAIYVLGSETHISTVADLQALCNTPDDWSKRFILDTDLDCTGVSLTPIGNDSEYFRGIFDGCGHTISNVTINALADEPVGLFGRILGIVRNLGVENVNITGDRVVGGLVGTNWGSIANCHATGSVSSNHCAGGLVGVNGNGGTNGILTKCYANVLVTGTGNYNEFGGLVGVNYGTIISCYSSGSVSSSDGSSQMVGGLVGFNNGDLTDCYAHGSVYGGDLMAGLVGWNTNATITNCYSTGLVDSPYLSSGFVDRNDGTLTNCFWDINTSGKIIGAKSNRTGVIGKTTAEMKTITTFTSSGWDFSDDDGDLADWRMPYDNYPHLQWETSHRLTLNTTGNGNIMINYNIISLPLVADFPPGFEASLDAVPANGWLFDYWSGDLEGNENPALIVMDGDKNIIANFQLSPPDPDINEDTKIDLLDYSVLSKYWQATNCTEPNWCERTDVDKSGDVGLSDLLIICEHWLEGTTNLALGLTAHYKLDGLSGLVIDETGNHNGTYNGVLRGETGIDGNAFGFDGIDDYVNNDNRWSDVKTISFWFKTDGNTARNIMGARTSSSSNKIGLDVDMIKISRWWPFASHNLTYAVDYTNGEFWHVVYVNEGDDGSAYLYVNGELRDSEDGHSLPTHADYDVLLGAYSNEGIFSYFDGIIDEVRIYNRALSEAEVLSLYQNP